MTTTRKPHIAVVGRNSNVPEDVLEIAERIGKEIAERGAILVSGGRQGVVEAACRGAKRKGGTTVGIIQTIDKEDANPYVDVVIGSGMGLARNALVVTSADVVIAINGNVGTMSEISTALDYGIPVVVVKGTGGVAGAAREFLDKMDLKKGRKLKVHEADSKSAVKTALELIRR